MQDIRDAKKVPFIVHNSAHCISHSHTCVVRVRILCVCVDEQSVVCVAVTSFCLSLSSQPLWCLLWRGV